ncbi:MAG: hypothetical protein KDA80_06425 [Planctomycetaceae bacterium]|nr:hypothetical protein [Planctomycetaceae bacterium]
MALFSQNSHPVLAILTILVLGGICSTAQAQITPAQRRELTTLSRDVSRASSHLRKKEFDEAKQILDDAEEKLEEIKEAAMVDDSDRAIMGAMTAIARQRAALDKAQGAGMPGGDDKVSFVEDIAPLVQERCLRCHGATNPRAGLSLETFAGWKQGGRTGPLLVPGAAQRSLIMARLATTDANQRMPANGNPLSQDELQTFASWINLGAKFDGENEQARLADVIFEHEKKSMDVKLPMAKGDEKVKFTEDIAPWFANLCLGCHNERRKSGGLSVATYFDIMKGGDSGEVVIPGDMENSRLFRLVGGLELPRMPQGQARITRQNYDDLKQWFREGNTYDGSDVRTQISTFVRSEQEMAADQFNSMTVDEFAKYRTDRSQEQLRRAVPNDPHASVATNNFLVLGNASEARLQEASEWAESQLASLHETFSGKELPWRGKLAVFVMKDRFSYDEFNEVIERRRADAEMHGHSKVTANHEDAYIVLQDIGDNQDDGTSLKSLLVEHLTGAYLQQSGSALPNWVVRGTGLVMATSAIEGRKYFNDLEKQAKEVVPTVLRPEDVFEDGTFSPSSMGPVGYTLVKFLMDSQGTPKFVRLVGALQQGRDINAATQAAYGTSCRDVAVAYMNSLKR